MLGLVGKNGIGKSTALKVLAGELEPNLGRFTVRTKIRLFFCFFIPSSGQTCLRFYCIHF